MVPAGWRSVNGRRRAGPLQRRLPSQLPSLLCRGFPNPRTVRRFDALAIPSPADLETCCIPDFPAFAFGFGAGASKKVLANNCACCAFARFAGLETCDTAGLETLRYGNRRKSRLRNGRSTMILGGGKATPRGGKATQAGGKATPRGGRATPPGGRATPRGGSTTVRPGRAPKGGVARLGGGRATPGAENAGPRGGRAVPDNAVVQKIATISHF
jgi:hypothetical protein